MATQVRGADPRTLEDAVQYAEDKCGEYGEGRRITDWRMTEQRYREVPGTEDNSQMRITLVDDTSGKAVSRLAETAEKEPISLAALQALMTMVGVGKITEASGQTADKLAAAKPKARALEVKAERHASAEDEAQQQVPSAVTRGWWNHVPGGTGGRRYGGRWQNQGRGRGGGRGPIAEYYAPDTMSIAQRKVESECSYCGQRGHWWRECTVRIAAMGEEEAPRPPTAAATSREAPHPTLNLPQQRSCRQEMGRGTVTRQQGHMVGGGAAVWGKSVPAVVGPAWGKSSEEAVSARIADGGVAENRGSSPSTQSVVLSRAGDLVVRSAATEEREAEEALGQKTDTEDDGAQRTVALRLLTEEMSLGDGAMSNQGTVNARRKLAAAGTTAAVAGELPVMTRPPPSAVMRKQLLITGGVTKAAKRRQRRTEAKQAAATRMLAKELREEYAERAKVLRLKVKRVITELHEVANGLQGHLRRCDAQISAKVERREEQQQLMAVIDEPLNKPAIMSVTARMPRAPPERIDDTQWATLQQQYEKPVPKLLEERGTLEEMRAARRKALKDVKRYRAVRRIRRLQRRQQVLDQLKTVGPAEKIVRARDKRRKRRIEYQYKQQGSYGDCVTPVTAPPRE
ncbi:unnamed protein product [Phytophthora fragariaefolia]|uniref:Unnamed protein product n=1 Tax=Phytophthora fragariaefolia TaxID=1490495 RepID=A0A9W6XCE2_9STRA|nr:unnamed protein product [Phytophthora fragariaefolia]